MGKRVGGTTAVWALWGLCACGPRFTDDPKLLDISGQAVTFTGPTSAIFGRTGKNADQTAQVSWAGTTLSSRFTGDSVTAHMQVTGVQPVNYYLVALDGNLSEVRAVPTTDTSQTFAAPPGDGPHTLSLTKLNEALDGELVFGGFEASAGGALLPTQTPTGRRMEFIGDSITCGYGNEGIISTKMLMDSTSADQNSLRSCKDFLGVEAYQVSSAYLAWGPQVARKFLADWRLICWSGKGVYRNADDTNTNLIPDLFSRSVASQPNSVNDANAWVPQAVVVDMGTNDFGSVAEQDAGGKPDIELFSANYTRLVKSVRHAYPNAWIFLAVGPMLSDYYPTSFKALTTMRQTVNDIIKALGDDRVQYFEFPLNITTNADATGCEWHPDVDQDTAMATRLEVAVQKYLGWQF